ncbi:ankyrin repeat-containing domain protein, partial [Dactylonectria estremocensis]
GYFDLVQKSIAGGVDPNARGGDFSSALHTSVVYGRVEIIRLLLAQERIPLNLINLRGRTPLWQAASHGHLEIPRKLTETSRGDCKGNSYSSGRNVVWFAAYNSHVDIVRMLLKTGADLHEADNEGLARF